MGLLYIHIHSCRSELHKTRTELATVQLQYVQVCNERENTTEEKKVIDILVFILHTAWTEIMMRIKFDEIRSLQFF